MRLVCCRCGSVQSAGHLGPAAAEEGWQVTTPTHTYIHTHTHTYTHTHTHIYTHIYTHAHTPTVIH